MKPPHRIALLVVIGCTVVMSHGLGAQPTSAGELVIAWHVTLAPACFDPAAAPGADHPLRTALCPP